MAEQWVRNTFTINNNFDAIDWGNGIYTPVSTFVQFYGDIIAQALDSNQDPKQAIIASDPNNEKGFNNYLSN